MTNISITIPKPISLDNSGELYYNTKDLYEYKPVFFRGCINKKRLIIGRKGIPEAEYKYVNFINKTKTWHVVDQTSKKAQLMITKKWIDEFYFTETDTASKPVAVVATTPILEDYGVDLDDKDEVVDVPSEPVKIRRVYDDEPPLLELTDDEKFCDCDGNVLEIETRGERHEEKIFFKVVDVSKAFGMENLRVSLSLDKSGYEYGLHYKNFNRVSNSYAEYNINIEQAIMKDHSNRTYLYLTYTGLIRVLIVSRNKNATRFTAWAVKQLFTVHLGTVPDKIVLASKLLHVGVDDCIAVFRKYSKKFPCIYLLSLGKVGDLKSHFGITDETIADDAIIYKYGFTDNIQRRLAEHKKTFGKIQNCNLDLVVYNYIDVESLAQAEVEISRLCKSYDAKLEIKDWKELVVLDAKQLERTKEEYDLIGWKFSTASIDLQNSNHKLNTEIVELKLRHQIELQEQNAKLKDEYYRELRAKDEQTAKLKEDHYRDMLKLKDEHSSDLRQLMEMLRPRA
jgi:hypothetical protein